MRKTVCEHYSKAISLPLIGHDGPCEHYVYKFWGTSLTPTDTKPGGGSARFVFPLFFPGTVIGLGNHFKNSSL